MKKLAFVTMVASLVMSATACGRAQKSEQPADQQKANKTVLVAYFSATGTTARVAKNLAKAANADLFEIKPEKTYTSADLDWNNKQSRSTVEMNNKKARPEIANKVADMNKYNVIYVGFPIWWYTAPRIINTFLESYDLKGKTIIPFATSGGSDVGDIYKELKTASAPDAKWEKGKLLNGDPSVEELKEWVSSNK